MRRFCAVNNNQLIHDICILLFRYPPILRFIPWTWSRQPGELSKHLFPHNLQCMHCFMWIRWLKNQQPGLSLHFHCHFFLHSLAYKRKKSWLQVTSRQHLLRSLCKHILYMVTLWVTVLILKNKQVDISTTFCFLETISWFTLVTILIMTKLLQLCQTSRMLLLPFLTQRLIRLPIMRRPLPSLTILCRVNWKRFTKKNRERDKRELDLSKKPKVLVAVDKIKELFPETCRACGGLPFLWSKQCQVLY